VKRCIYGFICLFYSRGISRGSLIDHPRIEGVNDVLTGSSLSRELHYIDPVNHSAEIVSFDKL